MSLRHPVSFVRGCKGCMYSCFIVMCEYIHPAIGVVITGANEACSHITNTNEACSHITSADTAFSHITSTTEACSHILTTHE